MDVGLRAEKKIRTRRLLADAAYQVIQEAGVEALTAEAVAARAGVSRRTFFNYFSSVEDALAATTEDVITWLASQVSARPRDEDILTSLITLLDTPVDVEWLAEAAVLQKAAQTSNRARAAMLELTRTQFLTTRTAIAEQLADRVDADYIDTLTAALVGVVAMVQLRWSLTLGPDVGPQDAVRHRDMLVRALTLLRSGFPN